MAIYVCVTPTGPRLVSAKTPVAALTYAMGTDGYTAEALSTAELVAWQDKGLKVEHAPAPVTAPKHPQVPHPLSSNAA